MTQYELQELAFAAGGLAAAYGSITISIISAYLLVAYTAGRELMRSQVVLINTLFVFTASLFLYGTISSLIKQLSFVNKLRVLEPEGYYPTNIVVIVAVALIFALIIIACLKFMWDIRHPVSE